MLQYLIVWKAFFLFFYVFKIIPVNFEPHMPPGMKQTVLYTNLMFKLKQYEFSVGILTRVPCCHQLPNRASY